ncbi:MAG: hypothetical protein R3D35_09015 [Nitratireductor sp.]
MPEAVLSDEHYILFGRIAYGYAAAETGFKLLLAAMTKTDIGLMMVLSEPYTAKQLRDVVQSIAHASTFDGKNEKDQLIGLLGEHKRLTPIRTAVAHFRWTNGTRENSIRPVSLDIRSGKAIPRGYEDSERDYTVDDLVTLANDMFKLNNDLRNFIRKNGYEDILEASIQSKDQDDD